MFGWLITCVYLGYLFCFFDCCMVSVVLTWLLVVTVSCGSVDGLLVDEFAFFWGCCFTLFVVLKLLEFFVSVWLVSRLFVIGLFIDLLVCYLL